MRCLRCVTVSALFLAGCAQDYFPVAPHQSTRPGLAARVDSINLTPPLTVHVSVHGVGSARIRRALLAPSASAPCREGIRETQAMLDGHKLWARPFDVGGPHELVLVYSPGAAGDLLAKPSALDFVLASDRGPDECLRVELTGAAPAQRWNAETTGSAGVALRVLGPIDAVDGVGGGYEIASRIGAYLGPVRLLGEVGFGEALCVSNCGSRVAFWWMPFGVSAHWVVADVPGFSLDLGLAYRMIPAFTSGKDDGRTAMLHGPELRLRLGESIQRGPGLPSGARIGNGGYEFFVAQWRGDGPNGPEQSLVIGIGIAGEAGF